MVVVFPQLKIFRLTDRHLPLFYFILIFLFCTKKYKNLWVYIYFYCTSTTGSKKWYIKIAARENKDG